jgi:hypothetical protein
VTCAIGVAVLVLGCCVPRSAADRQTDPSPPAGAEKHALILRLSPFGQASLRRAIDLALAKLAGPECSSIYEDFTLQNGVTPRRVLDGLGMTPSELLESLVFIDGSWGGVCRKGRAALTTTPGSRVIHVCPGFTQLQSREPERSAYLIIHESLHALGLGEDPPSSSEITQRVERRCWKGASLVTK